MSYYIFDWGLRNKRYKDSGENFLVMYVRAAVECQECENLCGGKWRNHVTRENNPWNLCLLLHPVDLFKHDSANKQLRVPC